MPEIRGYATHAAGAELLSYRYEVGELGADEVEIRISHCGVCRSDLHLIDNDWQVSKYPFVPGHEIVGTVEAVGSAVQNLQPDQRVGVGWQAGSCGNCKWCRSGKENLCPQSQPTCVHRNGGFAGTVRVPARFVVPIPEALDSENAAPLLCAGITVYTPLRTYGVSPASRVGVVGIGGLGHLALQFARAFGAEVTAFSTSPAKEDEARAMGAHHFSNSRESKVMKARAGSLDLIVSTVNADQDWAAFLGTLRPEGVLCLVGAPTRPLQIPGSLLIQAARAVSGSNTGSPLALAEMLDVAARHKVKTQTERFPMAKVNEAVAKVRKGAVRYRAVLAN
ncbi:MAG TPA: NAD(P)-dependent alcohol dehydrogenase [Acidobacteriaceae bacterium]